MNAILARPSALMALAAACVAALAALSDFSPERAAGISDLDDDETTLSVIVLDCRPCSGGFLLEISDGAGGEATAFCPLDLLPEPLAKGSAVTATVRRSAEDPEFLLIRGISVPSDTVKD